MARQWICDAHRHLGVLPAYPFYGGPPVRPDVGARSTIRELIADLDAEGTERALVIPNYGVPDPAVSFSFNELCVEAAATDDRVRAALSLFQLGLDVLGRKGFRGRLVDGSRWRV